MFSYSPAKRALLLVGGWWLWLTPVDAAEDVVGSSITVSATLPTPVFEDHSGSLAGRIIVIDAGHGTKNIEGDVINPGAKAKFSAVFERDVTLSVAALIKPLLEAKGARVYLTRTPNNPWRYHATRENDNRARAIFANVLKADAYIRLHCDWNRKKKFEGYTNYYFRWGSRDLAKSIRQALNQALPQQRDNGVKRKSFVSVTSKMPTVLVEMGVLSNKAEAALLANSNFQARLAQAISLGVTDYFIAGPTKKSS